MSIHKRRIIRLLLAVISFIIIATGCGDINSGAINTDAASDSAGDGTAESKVAVRFINVGEGNCTYITFPDGKNMLIDCGNGDRHEELDELLNAAGNRIDYLVLTHPDVDHIGYAKTVVENNAIQTCFIPYIKNVSLFPFYAEIYNLLSEKCADIRISAKFRKVEEPDYAFTFLYPENEDDPFGTYKKFNLLYEPTESDVDALSPIIYLRCFGTRYLFFSDGNSDMEKTVVENYKIGFYEGILNEEIDLNYIDFLLVANHGGNRATSSELLEVVKPVNAIISVGVDGLKNNPSSHVIERLSSYAEKIYRTDVFGTVSAFINDGGYSVHTVL